jgi:superfamily II DNA or RNA helicase
VQIIEDKALLLRVKNPNRITTVIPKSKVLDSGEVLVKWGLEEAMVLKNLRIKNVPSPIKSRYAWTGLYKPFDHQKETSAFLTLHRRAFCFNEQGTGKTSSVIWAADYLMNEGIIKRVLVLCPLSIMQPAWESDLFKFAMHRTCAIAHSYSKEKRIEAVRGAAEFVILNYDGLEIVRDAVEEAKFDLIVVDECFVAGTPVLTLHGYVPIEYLKAGDPVLTSSGVKRIRKLVRKTTTRLVRVQLSNGQTIECTPDHPFFTDLGWVTADHLAGRRLVSAHELPDVQQYVFGEQSAIQLAPLQGYEYGTDLLTILRTESVSHTQSGGELLQPDASQRAGYSKRSYEDAGATGACIAGAESHAPQPQNPWWERYRDDPLREVGVGCATFPLGMELPNSVGAEAARLSYELQSRFRQPTSEGGIGSGWVQPPQQRKETSRREERGEAERTWVVGVSYIECTGEVPVFNVEVEGTPHYFVGRGYLVHNCNAYKNVQTKRFKTLASVIKPDTWVWMLTGTPASQSPTDAYGLAKIINPSGVPRFYGAFRDMVMHKITQFKWIPKPQSERIVHDVLQPAIRYTKEECLDLPDMTYVTRDVPLTPQQKKFYEVIRRDMIAVAAGEEITTVNAAANLNKLLQLSCGAVYSDTGEVITFDVKNRLAALIEVINEASHKVIVFAPFRHAIDIVAEELKRNAIPTEVIHGGVSVTKRTDIFAAFQQAESPQVLVIQPQAAAHGVTLHAANVVVWWGPITSYEVYAQANARVHRAGQRNPCTVVRLQGSPVEQRIYGVLDNKQDIQHNLMALYADLIK